MIVYCYDLKIKNLKKYNRLKRRFYYHLFKLKKKWSTKSVVVCSKNQEKDFDMFFSVYKKYLLLYKFKTTTIKKIY